LSGPNNETIECHPKQNFQEANGYCYWNTALLEAVTSLKFVGHVTPSTILVTSEESCLETVRGAWARKVLRAPSSYTIVLVGKSTIFPDSFSIWRPWRALRRVRQPHRPLPNPISFPSLKVKAQSMKMRLSGVNFSDQFQNSAPVSSRN